MIVMDAKILGIGTTGILVLIFFAVVVTPGLTNPQHNVPSPNRVPATPLQQEGKRLYIQYGCQYCHTQYIRKFDWGPMAGRLAEAGDYAGEQAPQLGSNRNGPDLSQAGGQRTDDWHRAHFYNPRWTRPDSFMPAFSHLDAADQDRVIAYVQSLGGKLAKERNDRQWHWRRQAIDAYQRGADENIEWLHRHVPRGWLEVPNPYPITEALLARGAVVYQRNCLGCHGPVGDGQGPAAAFVYPPPLNFTTLRRHGLAGGATGGMLYYQVMNGVTGTAMPSFKHELESEKIWDVSGYVARLFIGIDDGNAEPRGIDAAFEPADPRSSRPSPEVR